MGGWVGGRELCSLKVVIWLAEQYYGEIWIYLAETRKIQFYGYELSDEYVNEEFYEKIKAIYIGWKMHHNNWKKKHGYRLWICILNFADEIGNPPIRKFKNFLSNNGLGYHKFPKNMQIFYSVLSKHVHTTTLNIKFLKKRAIWSLLNWIRWRNTWRFKVFLKSLTLQISSKSAVNKFEGEEG